MPAEEAAAPPWAFLRNRQRVVALELGQLYTIGRDPARNRLVLEDRSVSGAHAQIRVSGTAEGGATLRDVNSRNGCFLNELRVHGREERLSHGDRLRFGFDKSTWVLMHSREEPPPADDAPHAADAAAEPRKPTHAAGLHSPAPDGNGWIFSHEGAAMSENVSPTKPPPELPHAGKPNAGFFGPTSEQLLRFNPHANGAAARGARSRRGSSSPVRMRSPPPALAPREPHPPAPARLVFDPSEGERGAEPDAHPPPRAPERPPAGSTRARQPAGSPSRRASTQASGLGRPASAAPSRRASTQASALGRARSSSALEIRAHRAAAAAESAPRRAAWAGVPDDEDGVRSAAAARSAPELRAALETAEHGAGRPDSPEPPPSLAAPEPRSRPAADAPAATPLEAAEGLAPAAPGGFATWAHAPRAPAAGVGGVLRAAEANLAALERALLRSLGARGTADDGALRRASAAALEATAAPPDGAAAWADARYAEEASAARLHGTSARCLELLQLLGADGGAGPPLPRGDTADAASREAALAELVRGLHGHNAELRALLARAEHELGRRAAERCPRALAAAEAEAAAARRALCVCEAEAAGLQRALRAGVAGAEGAAAAQRVAASHAAELHALREELAGARAGAHRSERAWSALREEAAVLRAQLDAAEQAAAAERAAAAAELASLREQLAAALRRVARHSAAGASAGEEEDRRAAADFLGGVLVSKEAELAEARAQLGAAHRALGAERARADAISAVAGSAGGPAGPAADFGARLRGLRDELEELRAQGTAEASERLRVSNQALADELRAERDFSAYLEAVLTGGGGAADASSLPPRSAPGLAGSALLPAAGADAASLDALAREGLLRGLLRSREVQLRQAREEARAAQAVHAALSLAHTGGAWAAPRDGGEALDRPVGRAPSEGSLASATPPSHGRTAACAPAGAREERRSAERAPLAASAARADATDAASAGPTSAATALHAPAGATAGHPPAPTSEGTQSPAHDSRAPTPRESAPPPAPATPPPAAAVVAAAPAPAELPAEAAHWRSPPAEAVAAVSRAGSERSLASGASLSAERALLERNGSQSAAALMLAPAHATVADGEAPASAAPAAGMVQPQAQAQGGAASPSATSPRAAPAAAAPAPVPDALVGAHSSAASSPDED